MARKTVLITGISGSGASYLAEYIVANHPNWEVHGTSRKRNTNAFRNLAKVIDKIKIHVCDLADPYSTFRIFQTLNPEYIFHLASNADVRESFDIPVAIMENNNKVTINLLDTIRTLGIKPRIHLCSTSEVYGQVDPKNVPIREDCPIRPSSPYSVSKTFQDQLGYVYFRSFDIPIITTRMFTYINPRRENLFATSFALQVARIEAGLQKELLHGNLDSLRTIIDVRDAMEAYWIAIEKCIPGEVYNIGGSTTMKVGEFLDLLKQKATCPIPTRLDPSLLRPADVTLQIPDTSKFTAQTGWKPRYTLEESIAFLLEHCRKTVNFEKF